VARIAHAIFAQLDAFKAEGPKRAHLFDLLQRSGIKGDLNTAKARYLLESYHEVVKTSGVSKNFEHDITNKYDKKGKLIETVDSVHEYQDVLFSAVGTLYAPYLKLMQALGVYAAGGAGSYNRNQRRAVTAFQEFKEAVITHYGSIEKAPTEIREFISKFEGLLAGSGGLLGGVLSRSEAKTFVDWAKSFGLAGKTIRSFNLQYTVTKNNYKHDETGRVSSYDEIRVGVDAEGNAAPELITRIHVSISYDPSGRVASQVMNYSYDGGGVPENAISRRITSGYVYDGYGSAIA
jgi:hypothetical protein